jgi:hypothetical protein
MEGPQGPRTEGTAAMGVRLRLGDPALVESLSDFLRRRECAVEQTDEETIEISLPHELHDEQARMELDLYLRVWQSLHGWVRVELID